MGDSHLVFKATGFLMLFTVLVANGKFCKSALACSVSANDWLTVSKSIRCHGI